MNTKKLKVIITTKEGEIYELTRYAPYSPGDKIVISDDITLTRKEIYTIIIKRDYEASSIGTDG